MEVYDRTTGEWYRVDRWHVTALSKVYPLIDSGAMTDWNDYWAKTVLDLLLSGF